MKNKESYGVICFRLNKDNIIEFLVIKKRVSYEYIDFINKDTIYKDAQLKNMFDKMTNDEKIDILSNDFSKVWYRAWLNTYQAKLFDICRNKYQIMMTPYNKIKDIIINSKQYILDWELPKGRKASKEQELTCAIRELVEETNINLNNCNVYTDIKFTTSVTDKNINYISKYFLCYYLCSTDDIKINLKNMDQYFEISDIKWMSLNEIKIANSNDTLYTLLSKAKRLIKKRLKINIADI